ncbi:unnamed protein product [Paramecium primaurelia]|uniref:Uncharacterized protein n=1 Tax=Paramecium primaurelia TaxID=5886 RepID=A0A8S1QP34_PARPR|nr:unnamed protein product [Paramecium primaurelia]
MQRFGILKKDIHEQPEKVIILMSLVLFLVKRYIGLILEVQILKLFEEKRWLIHSIYWEPSQPCDAQSIIQCLLLNQRENLIFSGHGSIKVWTLNTDNNQLMFHYQLNKHKSKMKHNQSHFSDDKTILIWKKKANERTFKFKQVLEILKNDNGFRVCFLNKDTKQKSLLTKKSCKLTQRIQILKIDNPYFLLFIIILSKYLSQSITNMSISSYQNQSFNIQSELIDCRSCKNYGNITEDGNYLIVRMIKLYHFMFTN